MGLMGRGDERSSSDRVVKGDRKRLRKLEKKRVKQIMKCISVSEVALPVGMHGYHRDQGVFVCWLPGYDAPVAADTAQRHAIESDWHKDKKIGVKLKWHADGFYTMRRRDSAAFIAQHTSDPPAAATTTATDYPTRAFKRTGSIATTADDADQEPASKRSKKEQKTRKALSSAQIEGHATVAAPAKVVAALTRRFSEVETEQSESEGDDYDRFNSRKRLKWTPAMDARLKDGVSKHKESEGWSAVASYVGMNLTWQQCQNRWSNYLGKVQADGIKHGRWTDEEVCTLEELVPVHVTAPHWNANIKCMTKPHTDWTAIAKQLGRIAQDCSSKWDNLQAAKLSKGPFTVEEDALIRQRVAEWGGKGNGLWVNLQKEMGRPANSISTRWSRRLQ